MKLRRRLVGLAALALLLPVAAPAGAASAATQQQLLGVTVGHHATFDRVTFRFSGTGVPSHSVSYVSTVVSDASGQPLSLLGNFKIHVVLHDIASTQAGAPAAFQGDIKPGFPQLREVKGAGDFEGVVSFGVGVTSRTTFRVSTLSNPSRLVLDLPIASSGTLPATGAPGTGSLVGWALALVATGALAVAATRRRVPVPAS